MVISNPKDLSIFYEQRKRCKELYYDVIYPVCKLTHRICDEDPIGYYSEICEKLNNLDILSNTYTDIIDLLDLIFHSNNDYRRWLNYDLTIAILQYISFDVYIYNIPKGYKKTPCFIGGGEAHTNLGKMILSYYDNIYQFTPNQECWHYGKRVDIYDQTNGIIYEIGNTDPSGFCRHLIDQKNVQSIYIIPFQFVYIYDFTKLICIKIDCKNRYIIEEIESELRNWHINDIKTRFNKREQYG